jgi:hypothetical protein
MPVLVVRCLRHDRAAFSVYPPGFTPYGRQRMAPVALDGDPLGSEPGPGEAAGLSGFDSTIFRAALDAASRRFWEPEPLGYHEPARWTQIRHLDRAVDWLGLGRLSVGERHHRAEALGVEALLLIESSLDLDSWRARGEAVCRVLERLAPDRCVLDRLLRAGEQAGLWGRPYLADLPGGRIREVVFPLPGTRRGGAVV